MRSPKPISPPRCCSKDLPAGQDIFYRVRFEDHSFPTVMSEPLIGRFRTAPNERRSVSFVWSGDTAGQGWGIDEARGGMRTYATMLRNRPDFFIHSGDHIYADCPIRAEQKLPNGEIWKNIATEEKSDVARTLAEFRGNYKYNLLDRNVRAFNAEVPMFAQWDDHEVTNDWCPGEAAAAGALSRCEHPPAHRARRARLPRIHADARDAGGSRPRLSPDSLWSAARRVHARHAHVSRRPTARTARAPTFSGRTQLAWLKRELMRSQATWKVIAADLPIGVVSDDAMALGDGPPASRECEIADLLAFIKHAGVRNTVWLTADMHYTAAHYYDPNRAVFQDFEPFWEFISGPLHSGTWHPQPLDNTFGPRAVVSEGLRRRSAGQPRALLRLAVLRSRRDRRRERGDDRDAQGRRRPGPLVGQDRAADGEMVRPCAAVARVAVIASRRRSNPERSVAEQTGLLRRCRSSQ